jgi:hypothetical protein
MSSDVTATRVDVIIVTTDDNAHVMSSSQVNPVIIGL